MTSEQVTVSSEGSPLQWSLFETRRMRTPDRANLPQHILRRVRAHIAEHLGETLRLPTLATCAGLSVSHFSRCFRNSTGMTPHAYLMEQRLWKARTLLGSTRLPIAEIALRTGFSDQSHFTRHFHRRMSYAPHAYRQLAANEAISVPTARAAR